MQVNVVMGKLTVLITAMRMDVVIIISYVAKMTPYIQFRYTVDAYGTTVASSMSDFFVVYVDRYFQCCGSSLFLPL